MSEFDIVVVGAGAAGLAAAKAAHAFGFSVAVIEAKERVGGRAYTEHESFGFAFDHGCQWLHSASINPYLAIAEALGHRVDRPRPMRRLHDGVRWLAEAEGDAYATWAQGAFEAIAAAASHGRDVAAAELIEAGHRFAPWFRSHYTAFMAAEPETVSTYDTGRYRDTGENWPVRDGFGALVARHGADVAVRHACPAARIDWSGPGVKVDTPAGTLAARAVVVTVSTAVLASGAIRFVPALPAATLEAIENLPLGHAAKVAFRFKRDPLPDLPMHFATDIRHAGCIVHVKPFGRAMITLYTGGALGRALDEAGADAALAWGRARLAELFGGEVLRGIDAARATGWSRDPWIGGAYSVARPGHGDARGVLARPVGDRVFIAGEATSVDAFSTAQGANQRGVAAGAAARAILGGPARAAR
jgi:monoamine oxidase